MSGFQHLVFIYGTLRHGGRAHHLMRAAEFQGEGSTLGKLVHVDEYPGLIPCDDQHVVGELYLVSNKLLSELDRYEGCFESPPHYLRQKIEVLLGDGNSKYAQTYIFQLLEPHHEEIQSGDWIIWMESNQT